jgi:hypothetical protein
LNPGKQKVYKLPIDPSSKVVLESLIDMPGEFGTISRCRIVAPGEPHSGGINGWFARHEFIRFNRYTRLLYMLKWMAKLALAKLTGKRLVFPIG